MIVCLVIGSEVYKVRAATGAT